MSAREDAARLVTISRTLAWVSLSLLIVNTVIQISSGSEFIGFTLAMDMITIGLLSGAATLIGRATRKLRGN